MGLGAQRPRPQLGPSRPPMGPQLQRAEETPESCDSHPQLISVQGGASRQFLKRPPP